MGQGTRGFFRYETTFLQKLLMLPIYYGRNAVHKWKAEGLLYKSDGGTRCKLQFSFYGKDNRFIPRNVIPKWRAFLFLFSVIRATFKCLVKLQVEAKPGKLIVEQLEEGNLAVLYEPFKDNSDFVYFREDSLTGQKNPNFKHHLGFGCAFIIFLVWTLIILISFF